MADAGAQWRAMLLALLVVHPSATFAQWGAPPPPASWTSTEIIFRTSSYRPFMGFLLRVVAKDAKAHFDDHASVLAVQRTGPQRTWLQPERWYTVLLVPSAPEPWIQEVDKARLVIRCDNFYIVGFANKWGRYHALEDGEGLIPGAVNLGFSAGYPSLVRGYTRLNTLRLGRAATTWARHILANYDVATGNIAELKRALAILVVTVCEGARFPRIREILEQRWHEGAHLGELEEDLVVNWVTFSCAILAYQVHHDWTRSTEATTLARLFGIRNVQEASREVDLVLQPKTCSDVVYVYGG
ncbi:unnamed protein product [Urochloa humidicola]